MSPFRASGKWKSDGPNRTNTGSSIRGRIGPPIPFPDDEEFPIRAPGTGIATPLGDNNAQEQQQQMQLTPSAAAELEHTIQQPGIAVGDFIVPTEATTVPATARVPSLREGSSRHTSPIQPSALRNSTTTPPSKSSMVPPQRKKSSLKSVFGRIFGKKRKSAASTLNGRESPMAARAGQHRSVSRKVLEEWQITDMTKVPAAMLDNNRDSLNPQKRSASLPINEYNRALRSHSVVVDPEDFTHRGTPDTNRDSIQADGTIRQRRATTPSRLWTPTKGPPGFATSWTGLSPRPASSHARGSHAISADETEAGIGMAVTSGSHPNRRSRSVGELRSIITGPSAARRRSDEIRYWRESYDPGVMSPMSSNRDDVADEGNDFIPPQPQEPPQPFNFGPMGEMAGMKITQAASLDTRVQRLESRMQKMERAIIRLHRQQSADALQLQDPPRRNSKFTYGNRPRTGTSETSQQKHEPRHRTLEATSQNRSSSYGSSRAPTVDTNTYHQPSLETFPISNLPSTDPAIISSQNATGRPLSTSTTIRGVPGNSPTIAKDGSFTQEHLSYLTNLIMTEQHARRELETLVHGLQKEIRTIRPSTAYPTPNSDHAISNHIIQGQRTAFSSFEGDDSSDDEARYDNDVFQTPNEERDFQDNTFGDVMDGDQKSSNRTMSLSRMTVGKGMQLV